MNRNNKKIPEEIDILNKKIKTILDSYRQKGKELDATDAQVLEHDDKTKVLRAQTLTPMEYAFNCGWMAAMEYVLDDVFGVLTDEEIYQSKLFKGKANG